VFRILLDIFLRLLSIALLVLAAGRAITRGFIFRAITRYTFLEQRLSFAECSRVNVRVSPSRSAVVLLAADDNDSHHVVAPLQKAAA